MRPYLHCVPFNWGNSCDEIELLSSSSKGACAPTAARKQCASRGDLGTMLNDETTIVLLFCLFWLWQAG
eukprot:1821863-Pyramimonas_sp.AAC.1